MLGAPCCSAPSAGDLVQLGVPLARNHTGAQAHWAHAAAGACLLGDAIVNMFRRAAAIGAAQGEAVLNAAQCCNLLLRYCVEPKLLHLLRALRSSAIAHMLPDTDARLQALTFELGGSAPSFAYAGP